MSTCARSKYCVAASGKEGDLYGQFHYCNPNDVDRIFWRISVFLLSYDIYSVWEIKKIVLKLTDNHT